MIAWMASYLSIFAEALWEELDVAYCSVHRCLPVYEGWSDTQWLHSIGHGYLDDD